MKNSIYKDEKIVQAFYVSGQHSVGFSPTLDR